MTPADLGRIEGPTLVIRLITPDDADYLYGLRTDPVYNRHLSEVRGTAKDQRRWIEAYKARESDGRELYYVIERKDGQRCGVVRLYDIEPENFTWGSWILDANKPRNAALESAMLSFGVGFEQLGRKTASIDVRTENVRAIAFYRRFGMTEVRRTDRDLFFTYSSERYASDRGHYFEQITAEAVS